MNTAAKSHSIQIKNHPFPFLLYLEWGLLAIAILSEFLPTPLFRGQRVSLVAIASVAGFGVMGLQLPTKPNTMKVGYTILEIALIVLATIAGLKSLRLFPFLYVVLVIRSCLMFKLPGRLLITGIAFGLFLIILFHRTENWGFRASASMQERLRPLIFGFALNATLLFGLALLFVLLLMNALLAERESREKLAIANDQLRQYALRIENLAMVQERNRIARDIHDALGHSLTGLNIQLEGAIKLWQTNPDRAKTFLQEAKRLGSTALQEVRQSVATLRKDPLQGQSLQEAIASLAADFQQTTGVQPDCQIHLSTTLTPDINIAVYRLLQEALTNSRKHAAANQINIFIENNSTELHLIYQDNGRGFQIDQNQTGFGLQSMRERILALGGQFDLISDLGQGTQIVTWVPLQQFPIATSMRDEA